jgi:hypothetical protein
MALASSAPASDDARAQDGPIARDTILVLGGPGAGKTVWIARLLDAIRSPVTLFNGRIPDGDAWFSGRGTSTLQCEFADIETKRRNESAIAALEARSWPTPTADAIEHNVEFTLSGDGVRTPNRRMTLVDLPGSALLAAFSPSNPSTLTIGWTVGNQFARTAAIVLVIDPVRATERSRESIDLANATVAMLEHLRASREGRSIPVAIVLSKCDRGYKTIMREGGVRQFAERHLAPILEAAGSARVYVSSATRSRLVSPGYREPSTRRPVENLVEPMHFLIGTIDRIDAIRQRASLVMQREAMRRGGPTPASANPGRGRAPRIPAYAWLVALLGLALLVAGSARVITNSAQRRAATDGGAPRDAAGTRPGADGTRAGMGAAGSTEEAPETTSGSKEESR